MAISTITQPSFRVSFKSELTTFLATFTEKALIFCDEDGQWYHKDGGVIKSAINGFYGECYFSANATTTVISSTNTYIKVAGTTVSGILQNFTHSNGRLTYSGTITKAFNILISFSAQQTLVNQQDMRGGIFKNGILIPDAEEPFFNTSVNQKMPVTLSAVITLNAGDYIEVFIRNNTTATNILVTYLNIKIN